MSEWKPIESAPKDGTVVLLYGFCAGEISGPSKEPNIAIGYCRSSVSTDYAGYQWSLVGTDYYATWMKATHWMPLPAPPTSATSETSSLP